jgi:hypothetical protein
MKIDLAKIDAQIKRLEEVRRIAADPELLSLLETVVVPNGVNGTPETNKPSADGRPNSRRDPAAIFQAGTKVHAVAACALAQEKPFSGYDLAQIMIEGGYQFSETKATPGLAVTDILRLTLVGKGIVKIHRPGKGSEPTLYERVL